MSPIQRGELENIVNAQIAAIVVLSRHLKWIKSSLESVYDLLRSKTRKTRAGILLDDNILYRLNLVKGESVNLDIDDFRQCFEFAWIFLPRSMVG